MHRTPSPPDAKPSGNAAVSRRRGRAPERASVRVYADARLSAGSADDIGSYAAERLTPTPAFSDVPASHWASKYIAYAKQAGIISGRGDDSFGPDDLLTGSAVAKLMNTVLGYGKIGEYSGDSWELNAISNALARGLITGDADLSAPATREEVIQYVFNTVKPDPDGIAKNYLVEYSDLVHAYIPSGTSAFQGTQQVKLDAYLGARVFGLAVKPITDVFGVNWRSWTQNGKVIVGDELYLADTLISEFVTEKKWSGGDLALAYEWDEYVELFINGEEYSLPSSAAWDIANIGYVTKTEPAIKRGSTAAVLSEIGLKVQLFDNGEIYNDGDLKKTSIDNGGIGKIVITYEYLAEVTRVDSARGTIDLKFWWYANPTDAGIGKVSTYEINDYPTDDTFAVKDYVVIILSEGFYRGYPGCYWDDSVAGKGNNDGIVDADEIHYDGAILAANILSIAPVEQVTVKATNYTRNANAGSKTTLATLTTDASDKYIFDSFYRFGLGDVPNFDGNALLILDSNGRVIGFTGDVAGPAAYKYVYVEDIEVVKTGVSLGASTVRASVYYPTTGETAIVYLPVKYESNAYYVTINAVAIPVNSIETGTGYLVSQSAAGSESKKLLGWYYYTSAEDASTITLRSNRTATNGFSSTKAGSIVTDIGSDTVYGVGQIDNNAAAYARPNPITGGFSATGFGSIYTDSKTLFYYRGQKYTGYTSFPYNAATVTAAGVPTGSALAVRGSDKIIDVIHVYRGESVAAATSTYAIIKAMPYDWLTEPGKIKYTVVGSTAAITNAGVYEESDTQEATYHIGEIVLVKQVGSEWQIEDYISANATGFTGDSQYTVNFAHPDYEYFTVPGAPVTAAIWTNAVPYLDGVAAKLIDAGNTTVKSKSRPDEGDVVRIVTGPNAFFATEVKAVVIMAYGNGGNSVRYLIGNALSGKNATYPANGGTLWNTLGTVGTAKLTASDVGLANIYATDNTDDSWKTSDAIPAIQTLLNGISPTPTITVDVLSGHPYDDADNTVDITATVHYTVVVGTTTSTIDLVLTITDVNVITTPRPSFTLPNELLGAQDFGVWPLATGSYDPDLGNYVIPNGAHVITLNPLYLPPVAVPTTIAGYTKVPTSATTMSSGQWKLITNTLGGIDYNYVILMP